MTSLSIEVKKENDLTVIRLQGQINEDSHFEEIKALTEKEIVIDLSEVSHINSCGIREWIELQKKYFKFDKVIYRECPQVIVEQMNIVSGFVFEKGIIESFYAPYYSEGEDKEYKVLLKPSEVLNGKAPVKKDESGQTLEFDDIEAQYFNFLKK